MSLPAELNGPELLFELFVEGLEFEAGQITVPAAPGLGVTMDEARLREHEIRVGA